MTTGDGGRQALLGIDVGGTFTDAVLISGGALYRAKVPTTAAQDQGVLLAAERVLRQAGLGSQEIRYFAHGMTTATNALLERKGARTAAISTWGFRDLLEIGRQNRPRLYDLCPQRPEPLVPAELRLAARERLAPQGELEPLESAEAAAVVAQLKRLAPEAVAVCLLFSFLDAAHERQLEALIHAELPGVHVSLSSRVLPQFREYERFSTTAADAYLTPVVARYLERLKSAAAAAGLPTPSIMQSSGGVLPLEQAAHSAAPLLLSGPAAGVVGTIFAGERSGADDLIAFDMGGTSTDVTLIRAGAAEVTTEREIGDSPVALPMVDIHTIGAGGGSIAWIDAGGALRVGPESAGAQPGPACYGRGGERPTVTDANLCLGYLGVRLGQRGDIELDAAKAREALQTLARPLALSLEEVALGIRRVANAEMVKALRVISVERGHDPRRFVLVAFGGAGPLHGADLAVELGIDKVLIPDSCGVLSALGMVVGDQRRDWVKTVYAAADWDEGLLIRAFAELEEQAASAAEMVGAALVRRADLRYRGQSHELSIEVVPGAQRRQIEESFARAHEAAYGYRAAEEAVELINVRLTALLKLPKPRLSQPQAQPGTPHQRPAFFGGDWLQAEVWQRAWLGPDEGKFLRGPAVIEEEEATTLLPSGWRASLDASGNMWLEQD